MMSALRWLKNYLRPPQGARLDIKRRHLLVGGIGGLGAGLLFHAQPEEAFGRPNSGLPQPMPDPAPIRPPGATAGEAFLDKCIRCGECMKACPTNAIQPAFLESGLRGMWSPLLKLRVGYCEYHCNLCGQVCPTGAIGKLPIQQKDKTKLGLAVVDRNRCLPWSYGQSCQICYDQCPLPTKAIAMVASEVKRGDKTLTLKQPQIDSKLCIGCGICENKCPVTGQAAIRVVNI
jgi:MauM/NapG family ferredoxin protein